MDKKQLKKRVMTCAEYIIKTHGNNYKDLEILNKIFGTNVTLKDLEEV